MAKYLKEVLKGVKSSTKVTNDLGGYKPKAGDEENFAKKHEIEKHADRVGNGDDVYKGTTKHVLANTKEKNHGYKKPEDAKVNESKKAEGVSHNVDVVERPLNEVSKSTLKNYTHAAVRDIASRQYKLGKGDLSDTRRLMNRRKGVDKAVEKLAKEEVEQIDELSTDTYHRAAKKAAKKAMWDPEGRSGKTFKKYSTMANKFRDKGMSQEKKEKAVKEETDGFHNSKDHKPLSNWPKVHAAVHRSFSQAGGTGSDSEKKELGKTPIHPDHHAVHNDAESDSKKMRKAVNRHYSHDVSRGLKEEVVNEGAKVDRMVAHIKSSEKAAGKSDKKAENIAWATANKRGMLDNKNKVQEEGPVAPVPPKKLDARGIAHKFKDFVAAGGSTNTVNRYNSHVNALAKKTGKKPDAIHKEVRKHVKNMKESDTPMDITTASNPSNSYPNFSADVNTGRNV